MSFMLSATKSVVCLFFALWVIAFSLCGFSTFIPAFLGLPHHASHSMNILCEQACLARSVVNHDATILQPVVVPLQSELLSGVIVAHAFSGDAGALSHLPDPATYYPVTIKRYQLISIYRL